MTEIGSTAITEGALGTLLLNLPVAVGAGLAARRWINREDSLAWLLAAATLAWTWITVGTELLGSVGALRFPFLLAWSCGGAILGGWIGRPARWLASPDSTSAPASIAARDGNWEWSAILAMGLSAWAMLVHGARSLMGPVQVASDAPIYHLYFASRWWKEGSLHLIATPFGETAATYFPAVGDVWLSWLMAGWGSERLAKIGQAPFVVLAGLAACGLALRLGARISAAVIASCWFLTSTPWVFFSFEANVDSLFVAGYLISAFFFVRQTQVPDGSFSWFSLVVGALAAGAAWGCKATGTVFVPVLLLIGAAAAWKHQGASRSLIKPLLILALGPMVMAGYWFGRNLWLTGNPLYPLQVSVLGKVWFTGWYDSSVMNQSQYYIDGRDLRALVDIVLGVLDPRLTPLWLAAVLGSAAAPRGHRGWVVLLSVLAVLNVGLYWALIPYRTQQRFMFHALGLAVVPLSVLLDRAMVVRWLAVGLLAVHLLTSQQWPFTQPPWDMHPYIPSLLPGLLRCPTPPPDPMGGAVDLSAWLAIAPAILVYVGLGVPPVLFAWSFARSAARSSWLGWSRTSALFAVAAGLMIAVSIPPGSDPRRLFYAPFPDYHAGWLRLERLVPDRGARIAYAGMNLPYYLLGMNLRNTVRYVNVRGEPDWLLHDFHREAIARGQPNWPTPRPGWDRVPPDKRAWLEHLTLERIEFLVVARSNPVEGPFNQADAEGFPIERVWADAHPERFQLVYGDRDRDPLFKIYRVISR